MYGKANETADAKAVGIRFDHATLVPVVVLKACGSAANQVIREAALCSDIPIASAKEIMPKLYRVPIDQTTTPDLFPVLAALLAHVIEIDRIAGRNK